MKTFDTLEFHSPTFCMFTSKDKFRKFLKKAGRENEVDSFWCEEGMANTVSFGDSVCVVNMDIMGHDSFPESLGMFVHEVQHVKQRYFKYICESEPSDEYEAYVVQSIFSQLYPTFAKGWDKKLKQDQEVVL